MGELGGLDTLTVTTDAAQGDTVLNLDSTTNLVPGQLLTYVGSNGFYRAARIDAVNGGKVSISSGLGLETAIPAGSQVSNFYNDPTHPNVNGYRAIADFGYRSSRPIEPNLTHVLLGDSWFDKDERSGAAAFENQLQTRLPGAKIVNAGIGGNTLCDLLERFDNDVASQDPQYVWINSSINDYFNDVSPQDYKTRMQILISKVQAIGAKAIVFDSAPSTSMSPSGIDLNSVSNAYASAVLDLYTETQP